MGSLDVVGLTKIRRNASINVKEKFNMILIILCVALVIGVALSAMLVVEALEGVYKNKCKR